MFAGREPDVTEENIQARIRGSLLMAMSNKFGALVLTTGNKSEIGVGYCTLYGDMCGGLAVISDVPKTLVYRLARYVNSRSPVIPGVHHRESAVGRVAARSEGQRLAAALRGARHHSGRLRGRQQVAGAIAAEHGYDLALVRKVARMVDRSEYKRQQAAPGLKISEKAFGFGRRYPIAAKTEM